MQVIRELIKPPQGVVSQLFAGPDAQRGRLSIAAAEFRQLVPKQDLQVHACTHCLRNGAFLEHRGVPWCLAVEPCDGSAVLMCAPV